MAVEASWDYRNPYVWMEKVARSQLPPVIITAAITGGGHGKEALDALPETPEEQADAAYEAYKAGAAQIHIHARDRNDWSQCTPDPADSGKVNRLVRERCPDVIINNSTGGGPELTPEEHWCPLEADPLPDVATLNRGPFMAKLTMSDRMPPLPHPRGPIDYDMCGPTTYGELNR